MRKLFLTLVAGALAAACGHKPSQSSEASAAEVSKATPSETPTTATPSIVTPVSFAEAESAYTAKRYGDAVRLFTTYTSDKPDNVWGYYMLGLSAWKNGDRDAAVNAFTLGLQKDSTHIKSHLNLSRVLIEQGRAQDALPHVEAAVALDSTSGETFRLLGRVQTELGDTDAAVAAYRRAIVLDENDVWALGGLGRTYIDQGKFDDALGPLARAIQVDSTVGTVQKNLGIALRHASCVKLDSLAENFATAVKTGK